MDAENTINIVKTGKDAAPPPPSIDFLTRATRMHWIGPWVLAFQTKLLTLHGFFFVSAMAFDLLATITGAYLVFRHERRAAGPDSDFPKFLVYLLPKRVFLHKSALLDYQVFPVRHVVGFPLSLPGVTGVTTVIAVITDNPEYTLADDPRAAGLPVILAIALLLALAVDFSNYAGHSIQHRVGFFWEFHKVHHAAEVLTPVTLDRTHPVEDIPKILISSFLFVVIFASFALFYSVDVINTTAIGFDVLLWVRVALFFRLRHSHIPMFFPSWLTTVFLSPVHHQTHHSSLKRHFDANYGQNLIIWDRLFGTYVEPEHPSRLRLGLSDGAEVLLNRSLIHLYWLPVRNAWRRVVPARPTGLVGGD